MFGSNKRYLSISINEATIKLAQVKCDGFVEKVARATAVDATVEQLTKTLKTLLNGFDRKAPVACIIPASAATAKNIEVPSIDPEEIKSIINLQASRHTPYSREEILISYINLGLGASNNTKVNLVIVHRNIVKDRVAVLENAGLNVDKILFAPEAIARFYVKALNLKKDVGVTGVLDIALNASNYVIVWRGSLGFVRHIPIGIKSLLESPDSASKLVEEFNKSVTAFVNEDINTPPEVYQVTTNRDTVKNSIPALQESLGIQLQINNFSKFIKGSASIKNKIDKDFGDDSFLDVIAPALIISKAEINLMPEEMILKKKVEQQSREASMAGVAVVVLMVLVGAIIMSKIYFKDTFLNKNLREQYAAERKEVQLLQAKMAKMSLVSTYLQDRSVSLDVIHELYAITPTAVYLNSINMDDEGNVVIAGISDSMSQVFSYVKALDDSKMFAGVKTKSTSTKKERGKDVAAFEITFKIE